MLMGWRKNMTVRLIQIWLLEVITQFAELHKRKAGKQKLNHLFTGIPMKIQKYSSDQAE